MNINKDIQAQIRLVAESMELGETLRQVCPSCLGGSSNEKSMTITVFPNSVVKYNCFRENCPSHVHGSFILGAGLASTGSQENTNRVFKPVLPKRAKFDGTTLPLTDFEREWIYKAWGIVNPPYWYHTNDYGGRIAMSVRAPNYTHRGWVLRDMEGRARHKALTYIEENETPMSWYRNRHLRGTVIVEDIPSAVRASKYVNAVALLGTGAGLDRATEIDMMATRPIMIALDQDATDKSFKLLDRWGLLWGQAKVMPLKHDLKDMQEPFLKRLIEGCMS